MSPIFLFICPTIPARIICIRRAALGFSFPPLYILPANSALFQVLVVSRLVPCVIHAHHTASDLRAAEVVHGQVRAALVLVLEPTEASALAGFAVARQLQEDGLAELGEDCDDIAFGELKGEATKENERGVAVVDVPGGIGRAGSRATVSFEGS